VIVDDKPSQVLSHSPTHHSGFAVMHIEAFFHQNSCGMEREAIHSALEVFFPGECQVIRIARIFGSGGFRQGLQTAVGAVCTKVGEGGRCRSPLREMRRFV
jgi:hypothetical protein